MSAHLDLGEFPTEFLSGYWLSPTSQQASDVPEGVRQQLSNTCLTSANPAALTSPVCEHEGLMEVAREEAAEIARTHQVELSVFPFLQKYVTVDPPRPDMPESLRRLWAPIEYYLEYERSATTRGAIRDKLMPYFRVARLGHSLHVIFICETPRAAELFREVGQKLERELGVFIHLITSTYAEVSAGEFDLCWNWGGAPVCLSQRTAEVGREIRVHPRRQFRGF